MRYVRLLLQVGQPDAALELAQSAAAHFQDDHTVIKLLADALRCFRLLCLPAPADLLPGMQTL